MCAGGRNLAWLTAEKKTTFFLILIILLCQVGGWVKNSRGCRGNWEGPRCFETTVCWRPKSSWGAGPAGPLQSLLLTSWEQQEETGEPSPHVLEGLVDWSGCFFFFVFFHTYIHTKWVSFLVNVPCLAIKIVCLDLWCWELNAHYWCKYCFCFPFRLEGTRPVTLEQMLIFASGIDCIPPLGFPNHPTIQFLHDSNGYRRIFPEANTCEVLLRLPLHPSYSIFTEYMESGILQSPTFGLFWVHVKVKSSLAFFTISLTILKCAMSTRCIFFGWLGVIIPFKGTAGVMLGYNSCTHEEWKT